MQALPSPGYSLTIRTRYQNQIGMLGKIASAVGNVRGDISAVDIVERGGGFITRDITVNVQDAAHGQSCVEAVRQVPNLRIINVSDKAFLLHLGGKLEINSRVPLKTLDDLMLAYRPGVVRVAKAIQEDPEKVFTLTMKRNLVGLVTDGSWVPGLGDVGPQAAIPVMEGKGVIFKELASVDAFPICLDSHKPDEIITSIRTIAPTFGAIDLEYITFNHCFAIERQLQADLSIPVFQGDRHGAAIVILAAMMNASRLVDKPIESMRVVISGTGGTATACAQLFHSVGITNLVLGDGRGILNKDTAAPWSEKAWLEEHTNAGGLSGELRNAIQDADVFVGVSGRETMKVEDFQKMAKDPIIFLLENYNSNEVSPEDLEGIARVVATGQSNYPNQVSNVLVVPGFFRGLLDARSCGISPGMRLAAARAMAEIVPAGELHEEYIVPSLFDTRLVPAVAKAVAQEAEKAGLSRRQGRTGQP